jgi:hypothetical protein
MPRAARFKQPHAIPPDRDHIMLLEAMAKSFCQFMPDHLRFTVAMFDAQGRLAGFISNSGKPFAFSQARRRPSLRQQQYRNFKRHI